MTDAGAGAVMDAGAVTDAGSAAAQIRALAAEAWGRLVHALHAVAGQAPPLLSGGDPIRSSFEPDEAHPAVTFAIEARIPRIFSGSLIEYSVRSIDSVEPDRLMNRQFVPDVTAP